MLRARAPAITNDGNATAKPDDRVDKHQRDDAIADDEIERAEIEVDEAHVRPAVSRAVRCDANV